MRVERAHELLGLAACCLSVLAQMLVCFFVSGWLSRALLAVALCLSISVSVQQDCLSKLFHQSDQIDCCGAELCLCWSGREGVLMGIALAVMAQQLLRAGSAFWEVSND